jgi:hypothetical protein
VAEDAAALTSGGNHSAGPGPTSGATGGWLEECAGGVAQDCETYCDAVLRCDQPPDPQECLVKCTLAELFPESFGGESCRAALCGFYGCMASATCEDEAQDCTNQREEMDRACECGVTILGDGCSLSCPLFSMSCLRDECVCYAGSELTNVCPAPHACREGEILASTFESCCFGN